MEITEDILCVDEGSSCDEIVSQEHEAQEKKNKSRRRRMVSKAINETKSDGKLEKESEIELHSEVSRDIKRKEENNKFDSEQNHKQESDEADCSGMVVFITDLKSQSIEELTEKAESLKIQHVHKMSKNDIILAIAKKIIVCKGVIFGSGVMEVIQEGFGFLRTPESNYSTNSENIYVSSGQIRKFGLRTGDLITGEVKPPSDSKEKYFTLIKVTKVGSVDGDCLRYNRRVNFDELTPLYPDEMIKLEVEEDCNSPERKRDVSMRAIDILSPLGKGQRALIVAPPKTGKTMLLQGIARSITNNQPNTKLIVLLIDERPEEVTDMIRSVNAEVVSSTFDEPAYRHVQLAEIVSEMAKRMVEEKRDVIILLDSITRLARAYNVVVPSSGKVLTGGIDSNALQRPKRFFGAARNVEEGGSLTIIATALVETGSRMDEVIFEEFKGTGNCEVVLDRKLAERRNFPAIDVTRSGTRKEELLLSKDCLAKSWILRRVLAQMGPLEGMEFFRDKLLMTKNNADFFETMNS